MDNGASSYRRFLAGDDSAFERIVKEYRLPLTFFIERFVCDTAAAEDIAVDVFMYILAEPKKYNFKVNLKTYLFMLGRSRALDYIRRRRRLTSLEELSEASDEKSLEDAVLNDEIKLKVNSALSALPQDMRLAVHLVYFEDLKYEEAARVMKKSKKQVDNLLYRAKKELKITLGKEGEGLL